MSQVPRTPTPILIKALTILARDIESQDGVATAALLEAAQRLQEVHDALYESYALNVNWTETADLEDRQYFSEYRKVIQQARHALGDDCC